VSFDLIVIGAGPAGAAAAMTAAFSGLRVALVDKRRFPRDKLCGGGLTGRAMGQYRAIFGRETPETPMVRRDCFHFHGFGADLGASPGAPPIHLIMRRDFDRHLVDCALQAGAADFTGRDGTLDPESGTLSLGDTVLRAPLVIAADGVSSPIARQLFGAAYDQDRIGFALEIEHPEVDEDTPLRIDFGAAEWGYGWQFPKHCGTTIGVGGVLSRNPDMKAALARYVALLGADGGHKVKGQFLPFGDFRASPGRGRVLLAGDAAGLVDPITGEGIAHALSSGALAAQAVAQALIAGTPDSALGRYTTALKPIHRGLSQARILRQILFRPALRPAFIRSFRNSRSLRGEYLRLMAGETEYGPLMRQMAHRLPSFALRAIRGI
jgi:geranylgeranyl reductase family protein